MKHKLKKGVVAMMLAGAVFSGGLGDNPSKINADSEIEVILAPICIDDLAGKLFVEGEPTPLDAPHMVVRHQDDTTHPGNAISIPVTYDVGAYTGFRPPVPYSDWQRGEFDIASSGTSAFQLYCTGGGMMMNSWNSTYAAIRGGGQNTVYGYEWSSPTRPWADGGKELYIQADLKLPWFANWDINADGNYPVGQLSFVIYMRDSSTMQTIAMVMNAFDNRPLTLAETILHDTYVSFASTYFGGTRYMTPSPYSGTWTNNTWTNATFYRAVITEQNLLNMINDINTAHAVGLSTDPEDYLLTSAGILQETFRDEGDQVSMGSSFENFGVYRVVE